MSGGYGPTEPATKDIQDLCDQVKSKVQEITGKNYGEYTAFKFRSQVVAGTNYLIKVHVGDDYIHVIIFKDQGGEVALSDVNEGQTKVSPLEPF
ncbi:cystatin-B-like [Perca fluviatilis]|uniref:cystatin-B-like n=1 Tax=Perca fluviatilis TaxID=8168 RepID=UPI0019640FC1|nr:cystatin-B-like [Perca fluviatilis]